jgi:hypothetical protein
MNTNQEEEEEEEETLENKQILQNKPRGINVMNITKIFQTFFFETSFI